MRRLKAIKTVLALFIVLSVFIPPNIGLTQEGQDIKEYLEQVLPPQEGRKITLDPTSGLLTITDTPSNHKIIRELIKKWDVGPRQVMIEAKFVEVREGTLNELGVEWYGVKSDTHPFNQSRRKKEGTIAIGPGPTNPQTSADVEPAYTPPSYNMSTSDAQRAGNLRYDSWPSPSWTGTEFGAPAEPAGLGLWIGKSYYSGTQLYAYLRALESQDMINVLSSPRVTTLSGQIANIELALIEPYTTNVETTATESSAFGTYQTYEIDEKKTGVFLEVTPTVAEGGSVITLDLHPQVSEVAKKVSLSDSEQYPEYLGWPVVDTRDLQTIVTVRSGQTIVIGGLMQDDDVVTERKVPLLGDIPLLGNLFKYKHVDREKKNLVIFLKATLVSPEGIEITE